MKKAPDRKQDESKKIAELKKQNEEYLDRLKRLQAEFENFQKRVEKERAEFHEYSAGALIRKIIDVVDNIERAIASWKSDNLKDEHVRGLEMIYKNFYKTLEGEGLRSINVINEQFDPCKHEIINKMKSDKPEGAIIEEVQRGYMFKDKVLRHAKVIISAGGQ